MESHDAPGERRFSASGLADQGERLAAADLEADVADRMHLLARPREEAAALHREFLDHVLERDQRLARRAATCAAVRRSPRAPARGQVVLGAGQGLERRRVVAAAIDAPPCTGGETGTRRAARSDSAAGRESA